MTDRPQVLVIGNEIQPMNGVEIVERGGVADLVNENGVKVGRVYVSRDDDKEDGTPQYLYQIRYEARF